jgi:signal transduction histidine kinase
MRLMVDAERPIADLLHELVVLLPAAWQFPDVAAARITLGDLHIEPRGSRPARGCRAPTSPPRKGKRATSRWRIWRRGRTRSRGRFLAEERELIDLLAEIVGAALDRRLAWDLLHRLNSELEQRVAERTAELHAKSRALEAFSYSVAHDLKAPLRGIHGYSTLLVEEYGRRLDEEGRAFLANIDRSALQMDRLIDDLLAYSRLERREPASRRVDLRALVESLLRARRPDLEERDVHLVLDLRCCSVEVDGKGLAQALRSYLDNAIKFTRSVPRPRIEVGAEETGKGCRLWVRDNGSGFDMRYHDRIFEIFQRLHRAEEQPGTGIGLAIVRKAAERWGGRAWAVSAPGQGSTFYLEIPKRTA